MLTAQQNWTIYRRYLDDYDSVVADVTAGAITSAQSDHQIAALKKKFGNDHHADFALRDIVTAWKTPMQMRMVAAQRLLKGNVARSQKRLIYLQQQSSLKARWGTQAQKKQYAQKVERCKTKLRQNLCDLFNFELAQRDLCRSVGDSAVNDDIARAAQRIAAIVDEDVRAVFCGDGRAQVEAVNKSKRLTAGEAERYTYANAGSAALGIAVNLGVTSADVVINNEKAAGIYHGLQYSDYKFLALSQGQAQPGAHLSVGDRAAFQKREMQPLLKRVDQNDEPRELQVPIGGDAERILHQSDGEVKAALDDLVDQLGKATAVPQTLRLMLGTASAAAHATATTSDSDHSELVVELKTTTAYHEVQFTKNTLNKRLDCIAGQCAIGGRQALMSVAGMPT